MYHMCDSITGLMILGMVYAIKSAKAQYHLKNSPRYTNALGDACFPNNNLPKLLDALGPLSSDLFQAETSWVRVGTAITSTT